jgi:hypothetical protein
LGITEKKEDRGWKSGVDPFYRIAEKFRNQLVGQNCLAKDMEHELHNLYWIVTKDRTHNLHAYPKDPSHDYGEVLRNRTTSQSIK